MLGSATLCLDLFPFFIFDLIPLKNPLIEPGSWSGTSGKRRLPESPYSLSVTLSSLSNMTLVNSEGLASSLAFFPVFFFVGTSTGFLLTEVEVFGVWSFFSSGSFCLATTLVLAAGLFIRFFYRPKSKYWFLLKCLVPHLNYRTKRGYSN